MLYDIVTQGDTMDDNELAGLIRKEIARLKG